MMEMSKGAKLFLLLIAVSGWFALVAQLFLMVSNRTAGIAETILRYFGFFTILTNTIVAVCSTLLLINTAGKWKQFISKANVLTAVAIYIFVVGLVYNFVLRQIWEPQGLQKWVDELLHTVIPLLFVIFWWLFVRKNELKWSHIPAWLIFPAVYAIYTFIRGAAAGFYPYPFLNVTQIGYTRALINSGFLVLIFLVFSLLAVAAGKISRKAG